MTKSWFVPHNGRQGKNITCYPCTPRCSSPLGTDSEVFPKLKEFYLNLPSESLKLLSFAAVGISSARFKFWYLPQTEGVSSTVTETQREERNSTHRKKTGLQVPEYVTVFSLFHSCHAGKGEKDHRTHRSCANVLIEEPLKDSFKDLQMIF